ncbi:MAG: YggT family protein [Deltaproteobacteria bacterium]|nr:YggT family protein [Deltaproteobacteria bacterium]
MHELVEFVSMLFRLYTFLVLARVVLSWVQTDPRNQLVSLVVRLTEPVMAPVRNLMPAMGGFDFSPILVLFLLQIAEKLVLSLLIQMA